MENLEVLLQKARELYGSKQHQAVIDLLPDDILAQYNSKDSSHLKAKAYYWIGLNYKSIKQYEKAIEAYNKAIKIDPDYTYPYNGLGNAYQELKQYEKAIEAYNKAIKIGPDYATPYNGLGNAYQELKQYQKAIEAYNKAIKIDPDYATPYNGLGNTYQELKQYEKAIEAYNNGIKINPDLAVPYNGLGNTYQELKQYQKAIEAYNKAIKIDPDYVVPYNGLGVAYQELKQHQNAIETYNKAIKIDPSFAYAYNGLGSVYDKLKQYDNAIKAYSNAIKNNASYPDPYYNIAQLFYNKGEYDNAISNLEQYIRLENNHNEYFSKLAKSRIEEITQLLKNEALVTLKQLIESTIEEIKKILLFKGKKVTHYTGISPAKAMILEDSPFRLSEGNFLNDTSEGRELFKFLKFEISTKQNNDTIASPFTEKPFIGSFVPDTKHDDLTLWRMYGKDGKDEACGCALTINREDFLSAIKNGLINNLAISAPTNLDNEFSFYRVAYRLEQTKPKSVFIVPALKKAEEEKLNELMQQLNNQIKEFKKKTIKKGIDDIQYVTEQLNSIAYLFKSAQYQYEHELRLVVNGVGFKKNFNEPGTPLKVYIELANINPVIGSITIGPKVDRSDEWASSFFYALDEKGYKPEILISHLPYK